jgi:hypothetical protein
MAARTLLVAGGRLPGDRSLKLQCRSTAALLLLLLLLRLRHLGCRCFRNVRQ